LSRGRWHQVPVRANGQLAFGLYVARAEDTTYVPYAIKVLSLDSSAQIASVTVFQEPAAFARFGLPTSSGSGIS
jgi:hypothetical protein